MIGRTGPLILYHRQAETTHLNPIIYTYAPCLPIIILLVSGGLHLLSHWPVVALVAVDVFEGTAAAEGLYLFAAGLQQVRLVLQHDDALRGLHILFLLHIASISYCFYFILLLLHIAYVLLGVAATTILFTSLLLYVLR